MLRQMMADGLIAKGIVDERSIAEIQPDELKSYTQCHFFAGIGGWPIALRLAGWPEDRPVWTGSCPCQPFSSAGRQSGKEDDRHLWPVWQRLIAECRPTTLYGEQVASAIAHGWLDDVYQGLEEEGYAVGSAVLPACSVGAPHKRDRLWFVAHAPCGNVMRKSSIISSQTGGQEEHHGNQFGESGQGRDGFVGHTIRTRPQGHREFIDCPDGKQRLVEPSIFLLVDGFQHRRPILHAIGNAIVPQVAAEFIKASM